MMHDCPPVLSYAEIIFKVISIIIATILIEYIMQKLLDRYSADAGRMMKIDPVHHKFLKHFLTAVIYFSGFLITISVVPMLKNFAFSVFASSGVLAIIIGFASKETFSNLISGLFIELFRPFVVGDTITIKSKDVTGSVEDITLRHTVIKTPENNYIMVPNSFMNSEIIENTTLFDTKVHKSLEIVVSYQANLAQALALVKTCVESHQACLDNRSVEQKARGISKVDVNAVKMGLASIHIRADFWATDEGAAWQITCDTYKNIKEIFDSQQIPFPTCLCEPRS